MKNLENLENLSDAPACLEEHERPDNESPATMHDCRDAPSDSLSDKDTPDIGRMIREAEERGYLRGRNELIEETLMRPTTVPNQNDTAESCPTFLAHLRPGFWDN